jgi:hypothetical protein
MEAQWGDIIEAKGEASKGTSGEASEERKGRRREGYYGRRQGRKRRRHGATKPLRTIYARERACTMHGYCTL